MIFSDVKKQSHSTSKSFSRNPTSILVHSAAKSSSRNPTSNPLSDDHKKDSSSKNKDLNKVKDSKHRDPKTSKNEKSSSAVLSAKVIFTVHV
jgi:hypothetical protein